MNFGSDGLANESYRSIQYLRAIAALMVVMHHARNPFPWLYNPLATVEAFARGVDVFFVISGFIMATVGVREQPGIFVRKRLIRIVPIYWGCLSIAMLAELAKFGGDSTLVMRMLQSMLFIPHFDRVGEPFPMVPPGWTLNYEMFFYAVFAVCLFMSRPVRWAVVTMVTLAALGAISQPSGLVAQIYTSPLLLEFAFGMVIGVCRTSIRAQPAWGALALPGWYLLLLSPTTWAPWVGAALIVLSAVALEDRLPTWRAGLVLGDASYFLYLSHHFVLLALLKVFKVAPLHGVVQFVALIGSALAVSVAVGLLGHRFVEKPLTRWLQRRWLPVHPSALSRARYA